MLVHTLHDCERTDLDALRTQRVAAALKTFLDGDCATDKVSARLIDEGNESFERFAVRKEVVDYENSVLGTEILFFDENGVGVAVGVAHNLRSVTIVGDVCGFGFLAKSTGAWKCLAA